MLGLGLAACRRPAQTGVSLNGELKRLVPPDTKALIGLDYAALRKTAFYQAHQDHLNIPALNNAAAQMGWDPRRELSDLLLCWNGKEMLIGGRGHFDPNEVDRRMRSAGSSVTTRGEYQIFRSQAGTVAFRGSEIVLAGPPPAIEHAIDLARDNSLPGELNAQLQQLPASAQIWEISRSGLPMAELPMRSDYQSALSNIVGYVTDTRASIIAGSGLEFHAHLGCVSDAGARRVNDALRGGLGLARLTTKDNELELLHLYDAIQVSKQPTSVEMRASLPPNLTDELLNRLLRLSQEKPR